MAPTTMRSAKVKEYRDYHLVNVQELKHTNLNVRCRCANELEKRVHYSRKYYRNRYDRGHAFHMTRLYRAIKHDSSVVISMSLDTLATLSRLGAR